LTVALLPGDRISRFRIESRVPATVGEVYRVSVAEGPAPGFPLAMKRPALGFGESPVGVVGFEMELLIHPLLSGSHVPRFLAAGDYAEPFLVMEWIEGRSVAELLREVPRAPEAVARIGAAIADALHDLHRQEVVHHDVKPENVILRGDGEAVLIDYGFSFHRRRPDLLGEEMHFAAGSAAYVSPEQLRNVRGDPRSDIYSLGALLYELATGMPPFGTPSTLSGMRDRLWRALLPPRAHVPALPPWLQEVVLRCLEVELRERYQSAAHVAFDLRNGDRVALSTRATSVAAPGFSAQLGRWWRARAAALPSATVRSDAPVILVAVDTNHPEDARQPAIQWTTRQVLSLGHEYRLMCVSVIPAPALREAAEPESTSPARHLEHLGRLRRWVEPLGLPPERLALHVLESPDAASALLQLAERNHVDLIVLGAPAPDERAFAWWRSVASAVTASAQCSVHVVRARHSATGSARAGLGERAEDPGPASTAGFEAARESRDSRASTRPA
jgi:nucleotide-binding universal stress UspA family protein